MDLTTKKFCWNCKVVLGGEMLLDRDFRTLKSISEELGIKYHIVSELAPTGRKKKILKNSKYFSDVIITRLPLGKVGQKKDINDQINSELIADE